MILWSYQFLISLFQIYKSNFLLISNGNGLYKVMYFSCRFKCKLKNIVFHIFNHNNTQPNLWGKIIYIFIFSLPLFYWKIVDILLCILPLSPSLFFYSVSRFLCRKISMLNEYKKNWLMTVIKILHFLII